MNQRMARPDGPEIERLREEKGWSRVQLGELVAVGRSSIYHIEHGRPVKVSTLWLIASVLGVPAQDITASDASDRISA